MLSVEDTEVYIPTDACVRNIPVQCLPPSVARKMGVQPSLREPNDSPQTATWICPVKLREKGSSSSRTPLMRRFLTQGQFKLPVVSSNPVASRIFSKFLYCGKSVPQAGEPDAPAACSRVASHRQNAIILYDGQIFLSVRRKRVLSGQSDSKGLPSPVPASQMHLFKAPPLSSAQRGSPEQIQSTDTQLGVLSSGQQGAVLPPQVSPDTVTQPQEELKCQVVSDFCSQTVPVHENMDGIKEEFSETSDLGSDGGIRDTVEQKRNKRGDGQAEDENREDEKPAGGETGRPSDEERDKGGDVDVEPVENVEESDHQADGRVNKGDNVKKLMDNSHLNAVNLSTFDVKTLSAASGNTSISTELMESRADGNITEAPEAGVAEEHETDDQNSPAKPCRNGSEIFPIISHITSLAEGWNDAVGIENYGTFLSSSEDPKPEEPQHHESVDGEPLEHPHMVTAEVSAEAQAPPPDISLQENVGEGVLPCFLLPLETHQLDFEDLERGERVRRLRNMLRKMEDKLEEVNSQR
ncbi:uncharacterized protein si:dkeyp-110g5.4 [Pygocentrus nattereri]|uniref:uncharacterized protein si:dkeyp-110g5.4 n=1 Tax=Pygocentrus nattereri TaxID=42514 RepID=UPI000814A779|nr:uncharacterized protein si:dkeyp-110g5.4 [Pygocentrus nattereri]XP_017542963.1 uncharacterized protein si:dkeyp-110g5.4 [Pygocentrus nattereri]